MTRNQHLMARRGEGPRRVGSPCGHQASSYGHASINVHKLVIRAMRPGGKVLMTITYDIPVVAKPTSIRLKVSLLSHGETVLLRPHRRA